MTIDYRKIQIYQGLHKILADVDFQAQEGEMIYLYWHLEKGIVLPEKNLVDTDASRDIEGGDEDEEE